MIKSGESPGFYGSYQRTIVILKLFPVLRAILICASLIGWCQWASGQSACVSEHDVDRMLTQAKGSTKRSANPELHDALLKLKEDGDRLFQDAFIDLSKDDRVTDRMRSFRERNTSELCPVLQKFGWPGADIAGPDGEAAAFFLLKNSSSLELQKEFLPLIISLTEKGDLDRSELAGYVDRLRLALGLNQLFGTEARIRDGFLVLYPIEAEADVDSRRAQYNLAPLRDYLRFLEKLYQMPVVKSVGRPMLKDTSRRSRDSAEPGLLKPVLNENDEVVRVETNLVNASVSVYSERLRTHIDNLEQKDFKLFEDDQEQPITFFAAAEMPFDLVLLIDLSGSTNSKRDLIRNSTRHFIEAARPADRVAIVTFSDTVNVLAPLTEDRKNLMESVRRIEGTGNTKAWDALKFTLDHVIGSKPNGRRRAVVFMTDGADNHLLSFGEQGSTASFAELLETVRRTDALIIPIYLDTEKRDSPHNVYQYSRKTLSMIAEESGGLFYKARSIEDLNGVYEQVIDDLGRIYSLGYRPTNANRDGSWRRIKIQINGRPDLITRARPGYYAN